MCDSLIGLGEWGERFIFVRCMSVCYLVLFCVILSVGEHAQMLGAFC